METMRCVCKTKRSFAWVPRTLIILTSQFSTLLFAQDGNMVFYGNHRAIQTIIDVKSGVLDSGTLVGSFDDGTPLTAGHLTSLYDSNQLTTANSNSKGMPWFSEYKGALDDGKIDPDKLMKDSDGTANGGIKIKKKSKGAPFKEMKGDYGNGEAVDDYINSKCSSSSKASAHSNSARTDPGSAAGNARSATGGSRRLGSNMFAVSPGTTVIGAMVPDDVSASVCDKLDQVPGVGHYMRFQNSADNWMEQNMPNTKYLLDAPGNLMDFMFGQPVREFLRPETQGPYYHGLPGA